MEAVYPAQESALARGRRRRRPLPRQRHRTNPVTFAEIEEVDEDQELCEVREAGGSVERRRRPDELVELARDFAEFRRRRARRLALAEPDEAPADCAAGVPGDQSTAPSAAPMAQHQSAPKAHGQLVRASSEPT